MMKKLLLLMLMVATFACASAQSKKVSILGDSYSTFIGIIPANYATFYPNDRNDVTEIGQTWWSLYIKARGHSLEKNDSWGGTTICGTGYGRWILHATTSFHALTVLAIQTSFSFSVAPTMIGQTPPLASINTRIGQKRIARISVLL